MFLPLVSPPLSTVRVGVISFGQWGPNHVRNFSQFDGCDVVRVCDASDARLTAAQKFLRGVSVTKNSAEITDATDIDAVVVATPTSTHFALVKAALAAGKDVLCEKPLARTAAGWYRAALSDLPGLVLPVEAPWTGRHVYHLFVIRLLERNRDTVAQVLAERGVQTVVHYPVPIHRQKAYAELGYAEGAFPRAEQAARTVLSLPMFPEMTPDHVGLVADALRAALTA